MKFLNTVALSKPLPSDKARSRPRDTSKIDTIVIHQTAVLGGFGAGDKTDAKGLEQYASEFPELTADECGLLYRYQGETYTFIYSPAFELCVYQRDPKVYTFHGNGSNRYSVGWAYDEKFHGKDRGVLNVDGGRAALRWSVEQLSEALGKEASSLKFEAHRQHSNKRGRDPGPEIWANIVLPVAAELGVQISERLTGSGKSIPSSWVSVK